MICENIEGWFPAPRGKAELEKVFGRISLIPSEHKAGYNVSPQAWERANMMTARDLPGVSSGLYVNKKVYPMLRAALSLCVSIGGYKIETIGGFNPRYKRGIDGEISLHSYGIAFDINAKANPMTICKSFDEVARAKRDIPQSWVDAFISVGFFWGGHFRPNKRGEIRFDPQHFQYAVGV